MKTLFSAAKVSAGLRFWSYWLAIGISMTLVVVYLSLANINLPQISSTIGDKINHVIAYSVLCVWFGQLFIGHRHRIAIAVCLVLLGVLMEVLQGMTSYRYFDWFDAGANCLGVFTGLLVLRYGADNMLLRFESGCMKAS